MRSALPVSLRRVLGAYLGNKGPFFWILFECLWAERLHPHVSMWFYRKQSLALLHRRVVCGVDSGMPIHSRVHTRFSQCQ
eukprot:6339948-Lingulodinium_polyedra.AAC.1